MPNFETLLKELINKHNKEADSGTPDFILAEYLIGCLDAYDKAVSKRGEWLNDQL